MLNDDSIFLHMKKKHITKLGFAAIMSLFVVFMYSCGNKPHENFEKALIDHDFDKAESLIPKMYSTESSIEEAKDRVLKARIDYAIDKTSDEDINAFVVYMSKIKLTTKCNPNYRDDYYKCTKKVEPGIYDSHRANEIYHYQNYARAANSLCDDYLEKAITVRNEKLAKRIITLYKAEPNFVVNENKNQSMTDKWEGKSVVLKPGYHHLRNYIDTSKDIAKKRLEEAKKDW